MNIYGSDDDDDDYSNDQNVDYDDGDDSSMPVARVLAAASMGPQLLPSPYSPFTSLKVSTTYSLLTTFCISAF